MKEFLNFKKTKKIIEIDRGGPQMSVSQQSSKRRRRRKNKKNANNKQERNQNPKQPILAPKPQKKEQNRASHYCQGNYYSRDL